jgi:hypothetical protein
MRRAIALILALSGALACSDSTSVRTGATQVLLTDSPFPYDRIARVDVHIVRVQVAATADTSDSDQEWTTIVEPDRTINLLELQSGKTTILGETTVSALTVGAVRLVINTTLSSVTDNQGDPVTVHWPEQGELAIHAFVQGSLALFTPDTPHNLVIDFDVGRSFEDLAGDGSLYFIPWIRALDDAGVGAIAGLVTGPDGPIANAAVTVLQGDPNASPLTWWKVATGKTNAQGQFHVAFLLLGTYIVRAEPLTPVAGCGELQDILVSNGQTTLVHFTLSDPPGTCSRATGGGGGPDSTAVPSPPVPPPPPPLPPLPPPPGGGPDTTGSSLIAAR